jgi:transcriptional regulator of heat shock response
MKKIILNILKPFQSKTKTSKTKADKNTTIENLKSEERYFKSHISDNKLFQSEYEISSQINQIISDRLELNKEDFETIIKTFNKIEENEHYDGSGWENYKLRLSQLFYVFGYDLKWDNRRKKMITFTEF